MKPGFDINTYKTRFLGGARQYLFFVIMVLPSSDSMIGKVTGINPGGGRGTTGFLSGVKESIQKGMAPVVSRYNVIKQSGTPNWDSLGGELKSSISSSVNDITGESISNFSQRAGLSALNIFGLNRENDMVGYLVRSTTLPGVNFDEKIIDWPGMAFKMAGTLSFNDWSVTFNIDSDGTLLQKFNKWQQIIANTKTGQRGSIRDYMIDQEVHLLSGAGDTVTSYKLYGCWPKGIGDVALDYGSQEFAFIDVTFSYQKYDVMAGPSSASNDLIKRGWNRLFGKV